MEKEDGAVQRRHIRRQQWRTGAEKAVAVWGLDGVVGKYLKGCLLEENLEVSRTVPRGGIYWVKATGTQHSAQRE